MYDAFEKEKEEQEERIDQAQCVNEDL